jgi:predicted phosphodiesterase
VLGDYGVGILAGDGRGERQSRLAAALERAVDHAGVRLIVTTGDNIYLGDEDTVAGTGNHDDDWYYSFYEPYRYAISRVPVYPGVGNHDTGDSEAADNRDQLADNLFTDLRFTSGAEVGRASVDPGLFYRVRYGSDIEFVAVDSTTSPGLDQEHFIEHPDHKAFLGETFDVSLDGVGWRIPFSHHPPYCAGPKHHNTRHLVDHLVPLLQDADVPVMFSGHEHNFQHQQVDGIDYIVTGAAGKLREGRPDRMAEAGTHCWADRGHFLIVDIDGDRMTIHPVTDVDDDGRFTYLEPLTATGASAEVPIVVHRGDGGRS